MSAVMRDWLGRHLAVGDLVIYPAGSGRSITMVIGEITGFGERTSWHDEDEKGTPTIKVQPLKSSRWKQHYGTTYYVDTRTGKRIDPWRMTKDGAYVHVADIGHYLDTAGRRHAEQDWRGNEAAYEYVPTVFNEYVEERHEGPKPVTIQVVENVTRWDGERPEPDEDVER